MTKRFSQIDRDDFVHAARRGDDHVLQKLLDAGMTPDARSAKGFTALVSAVSGYHTDITKLLLESGANPNLPVDIPKDSESFARTALNVAAGRGDFELIDLLLDHKADPRIVAQDGGTACHHLINEWPKLKEYQHAELELKIRIERMLALGVPINQVNSHRQTMLAQAISVEAPVSFISWLVDKGADVHAVAEKGRSMLHLAAATGHVEAVRFLDGHGVDVNRADEVGRTPLFDTADETMGTLLLSLGAEVEHRDVHGRTPLGDLVTAHSVPGYAPSWATFLLEAGSDLDAPDFTGVSPRMLIRSKRLKALDSLVHAHEARNVLRQAAARAHGNKIGSN